jgi:hypothetical protein
MTNKQLVKVLRSQGARIWASRNVLNGSWLVVVSRGDVDSVARGNTFRAALEGAL